MDRERVNVSASKSVTVGWLCEYLEALVAGVRSVVNEERSSSGAVEKVEAEEQEEQEEELRSEKISSSDEESEEEASVYSTLGGEVASSPAVLAGVLFLSRAEKSIVKT